MLVTEFCKPLELYDKESSTTSLFPLSEANFWHPLAMITNALTNYIIIWFFHSKWGYRWQCSMWWETWRMNYSWSHHMRGSNGETMRSGPWPIPNTLLLCLVIHWSVPWSYLSLPPSLLQLIFKITNENAHTTVGWGCKYHCMMYNVCNWMMLKTWNE